MRKSRFKWFLLLLFCVCMVAMMAPAAFAANASVSNYGDLVTAIANAKEGDTITLGGDIQGDVTIPSGKNIVLDLGGNTLTNTNAGKATLFVENGAVATVKNGTISGGKSHYNIAVGTEKAPGGKLTLDAGAFRLEVPEQENLALTPYVGRRVDLGIRPSDFELAQEGVNAIHAHVDSIEPLGDAYLIYVRVGEKVVVFKYTGETAPTEKELLLSPNLAKLHLFDPETEKRIND